jgi:3-hydroxyisobutyrate dehydrogenase
MKTVGLIGVGVMGRAAIPRIRDAGHELYVFDVPKEALARVAKPGFTIAASLERITQNAEVVLMFLPGPKQVEEVVTGSGGLLASARSGTILVDLSTVDPRTTERMAAAAAPKGVGYLDAPVPGRPASVGEWSLPVGGDPERLAQCLDILQLIARNVFHIGPPGFGNKIKLLNQMMFSAINGMTAEMMAIAEKVGIPQRLRYETISASQAATVSGLFKELGKRIATDDYDDPTFQVDLLSKDVALAIEMAREARTAPPLTESTQRMNTLAQSRGLGKSDTSEMWRVWLDLPNPE